MTDALLEKIRKRDGRLTPYSREKIQRAIRAAAEDTLGDEAERFPSAKLAEKVEKKLFKIYATRSGRSVPDVEDIQDLVEETLMEEGHHRVARDYILYREQRAALRSAKNALIGRTVHTALSINAVQLLRERYLLRDDEGRFESPDELWERVATTVARVEKTYGGDDATQRRWRNRFKRIMRNLDFLPNSPALLNAGTGYEQLASSIAIPLADDLTAIYRGLFDAARMQQAGSGTGFNFSKLRMKGAAVKSIKGVASGPVTFLKLFSDSARTVKQGGKREGANIGVLDITHPDILEFITAKTKDKSLHNFNISALLTDDFIHAVIADKDYGLRDPGSNEYVARMNAKQVFDILVAGAWNYADPGVVFKDAVKRGNPVPSHGIESPSACAEFLLSSYEQGFLGSVNLGHFATDDGDVDWKRLKDVVGIAVRFLDNMIDATTYPVRRAQNVTWRHRKIGLGVMGLAHLLAQLDIPYNSEEGVAKAGAVMRFVREAADDASEALGKERNPFPDWTKSIYCAKSPHFRGEKRSEERRFRNATRLAVSPTGSTSMIAEASSGIEPLFNISFIKRVTGGKEYYYIDPVLKHRLEKLDIYSEELVEKIANFGLKNVDEVPDEVKRVFVTTHDVSPEWHIRMQAAVQEHVDNAVSKTVNLPHDATLLDVENIFLLAWKLGCKGCTVYRDGTRGDQVLSATALLSKQAGKQETRSIREELRVLAKNKSLNEFSR